MWGLGAAIATMLVYAATGERIWLAIAQVTGFLNLFNLTPVWQLDGSRGIHVLAQSQRWMLVGIILLAIALTEQRLLFIVGGVAVWRALQQRVGPATTGCSPHLPHSSWRSRGWREVLANWPRRSRRNRRLSWCPSCPRQKPTRNLNCIVRYWPETGCLYCSVLLSCVPSVKFYVEQIERLGSVPGYSRWYHATKSKPGSVYAAFVSPIW